MNPEFLAALAQIEEEKGIPHGVLMEAVKASIESAYRKRYGATGELRVDFGEKNTGPLRIVALRQVVDRMENPQTEVSVADARTVDPSAVVGDILEQEVTPRDFGRIAAQTAKQVIVQRVREAEREIVFDRFQGRIGEVITAEVQRRDDGNVYVSLGPRVEALLPYREQIPNERPYAVHRRLKVYVLDVRRSARSPQVIVSRTHSELVRLLFELEVPEVYDGIVEIKGVEREPGFRAKIAVKSNEEKVDPVGACVGHRGSRVQAVVDELAGEKIDIVRYRDDAKAFLSEALSPAEVTTVELDEEGRSAKVVVPEDQLSLAIGKKGQNVRLASRLTGWKIDVVGEAEHEHRKREELWASQDPAEVRERVYDLASELGIASKEAIDILREMGVNVSSHVSTIDGYTADDVRRRAKGDEAVRYGPRPEGMVPSSSDDERFDEELAAEPAEEIDDPDANADDDGAGEPPSPTEV
ncbi:MAG: transcription termination/antitermination protein NusA [Armatimonadetes bacterium]|jgi:N utilization substance protein A|nr:transcription termination/antitermination protein NusA [Armatimonadota bacterium]MDI9600983.1 transcription termination factor NusA [Acidobacteriota bacterium]